MRSSLLAVDLAVMLASAAVEADSRIINGDSCILEGVATESYSTKGLPVPLPDAPVGYFGDRGNLLSRTEANGAYSFDDPIVCGKGTLSVRIGEQAFFFPVDLRSNRAEINRILDVPSLPDEASRGDERHTQDTEQAPPVHLEPRDEPQVPDGVGGVGASAGLAGVVLLVLWQWRSRRLQVALLKSAAPKKRGTILCFGGQQGYRQVASPLSLTRILPALPRLRQMCRRL
jgi:hypothetical protein